MTTSERQDGLQRLRTVLEAYGADPARWPAAERDALTALTAADPSAAQLVSQARALDRLLATPSARDPAAEARLISAIVARAEATAQTSRTAASPSDVVDLASARDARRRAPTPQPRLRPATGAWRAAGLLAASLVVGLYLGVTGIAGPALVGLAEAAGLETTAMVLPADGAAVAPQTFEEELL